MGMRRAAAQRSLVSKQGCADTIRARPSEASAAPAHCRTVAIATSRALISDADSTHYSARQEATIVRRVHSSRRSQAL
jgi:hypothetical protein